MEETLLFVRLGKSLRRGAACGASCWAAYASVEAFLASVAPRLLPAGYMRPLDNSPFTLFVFAIFLLAGAVSGAALGLLEWLLRRWRPFGFSPPASFLPSCAALSISAALALHLSRPHVRGELGLAALALCITLAAVQLGGALSERWARRSAFVANPWAASLIVLGALWVAWTFLWEAREPSRWLVAAVTLVTVALASSALRVLGRRLGSTLPLRPGLLSAVAALAVLGAAVYPPPTRSLRNLNATPAAGSAKRPNVLLIVLDTVRADHLSVYGYTRDTTPFLREFARQATLYRRAWSTGDMTLTSHASMFTGLYGSTHGAHLADPARDPDGDFGAPLAGRHVTLAEALSGAGYLTAAVVANHVYLSEGFNLNQGFRYYEISAPFWGKQKPYFLRQPVRTRLAQWLVPEDGIRQFSAAGDINRRARAILERVTRSGRPFFLFLNYMDAHQPNTPPAPFNRMFAGPSEPPSVDFTDKMIEVTALYGSLAPEERAYIIARYDASLAYLDHCLRGLVEELRRLGQYDNTLIIITSDHGEAFGRRNHMFHVMSVYENQTRIPLLIKYPGQRQGAAVEQPASLVDVFPTVLDTAGLPLPAPVEGVSLRRLEAAAPRTVLAESYPNAFQIELHPRFRRVERAAIRWPYKLIADTHGKRELYDLESDPTETRNLYAEYPAVAASLLGELERRVAAKRPAPARWPDAETLRRLRSLGYTQ
ncbi:MAG TPA: sulfatase-like hydrolase/transferase [Bryobacteraceae bacterium]|nr:sulfatase-like hydrolase/transferase [Bryobacteraceae bacterium]